MLSRSLLRQSRNLRTPTTSLLSSIQSRSPALSTRLPAPARARIASRWYSSEQATESEKKDDAAKEEDPRQKELDAKNKEIIDLKDKYLRSVADFRNLQERSRREQQSARDFAIQKFARDLIESVDNLDLALGQVAKEKLEAPAAGASEDPYKELRELHGGLKMTSGVLLNTLGKHGLERFDPSVNSEKFDPNLHEATFQAPQPDKEDGTVFHTVQKGFTLNGRVLRAPKVGVVKNS